MSPRKKPEGQPTRVSGYYDTPAGKFMSVTTILTHGEPKPDLQHWAAREVAKSAVENLPTLAKVRGRQAREECYEWLANAAEHKRDSAGSFGSKFHDYAEAYVLEKPMPEPEDAMRPYVDAFYRFLDEWQPEFEATELVVANPEEGYAGTADFYAKIPRLGPAIILGDYKSGKGVYASAAMQEAAYQRATVAWTKDGTEVVPPRAERCVVVHVRPEKYGDRGGYAVLPMDTSDEAYAGFKAAQAMAQWRLAHDWVDRRKPKLPVVGRPMDNINDPEEAA